MTLCSRCSRPLGTTSDCPECLSFLAGKGADSLSRREAREAGRKAEPWSRGRGKSAPAELVQTVRDLAGMVRSYFGGQYTRVPWPVIASAAFAILYAVNPFDLVPDIIPGLGFVDDTAIITLVLASIRGEIEAYRDWKETGEGEPTEERSRIE